MISAVYEHREYGQEDAASVAYIALYTLNYLGASAFFALPPAGLVLLSVTGHAGGPREHWVQAWALVKVRGTCSRGSKSRNLANNHGIAFRPPRANKAHANPQNQSSISATGNILFFRLWLLLLRYNSRDSSFSLYDSDERCFCVWARVSMRACAQGVDSVIMLSLIHI